MGIFINTGNEGFRSARNSEYVDKSGLIAVVNNTLFSEARFTFVRNISERQRGAPRRVGHRARRLQGHRERLQRADAVEDGLAEQAEAGTRRGRGGKEEAGKEEEGVSDRPARQRGKAEKETREAEGKRKESTGKTTEEDGEEAGKAEGVEEQEDAGQGGRHGSGGYHTGQTPQGEAQGQQRLQTEEKGQT